MIKEKSGLLWRTPNKNDFYWEQGRHNLSGFLIESYPIRLSLRETDSFSEQKEKN